MIWTNILAEIKRGLKEPTVNGHWSDADFLRRANSGMRRVVRLTGCMRTTDTSDSTVIGTNKYAKPNKCLRLMRVYYKDVGNKLYPTTVTGLDLKVSLGDISDPWSDESDEPTHYCQNEEIGFFFLYPNPDAVETLGKEYLLRPDALVNGGDTPFNSLDYMEEYHELLVEFVLWKCMVEDQNDIFKEHKEEFFRGIVSIKSDLKKPGEALDTFTTLRSRRGRARGPLPLWD